MAIGLSACGTTGSSSTGDFKGAAAGPAEAISNFQSDASANDAEKICQRDLSKSVKDKIAKQSSTCVKAIERQLREADTFSMTVEGIQLSEKATSATAQVKSTWSGKQQVRTLTLVKEGGTWKVSGMKAS